MEKMPKKKKPSTKGQLSLTPFIQHCGGDVEKNIKAFNHAMGQDKDAEDVGQAPQGEAQGQASQGEGTGMGESMSIYEELHNVVDVDEKSREVANPDFAAAVREIKKNNKARDKAGEVRKAPKSSEEVLPKDLRPITESDQSIDWTITPKECISIIESEIAYAVKRYEAIQKKYNGDSEMSHAIEGKIDTLEQRLNELKNNPYSEKSKKICRVYAQENATLERIGIKRPTVEGKVDAMPSIEESLYSLDESLFKEAVKIPRNAKRLNVKGLFGKDVSLNKTGPDIWTDENGFNYGGKFIRAHSSGVDVEETDPNYKPKRTEVVAVLQGKYAGYWEDVIEYTADTPAEEIRDDFKSYEENETQYPHRIIHRRVPIEEALDKVAITAFDTKPLGGGYPWVEYTATFSDGTSYTGTAKVFYEQSTYGIRNGRVSKFTMNDAKTGEVLANYDRGWDIYPKQTAAKVNKIIKELESMRADEYSNRGALLLHTKGEQ